MSSYDVEVTSMQHIINDNENLSTYYTVPIKFSMYFLCINETNSRQKNENKMSQQWLRMHVQVS